MLVVWKGRREYQECGCQLMADYVIYAHAPVGLLPQHICQALVTDFPRRTTSKQIQHKQPQKNQEQ